MATLESFKALCRRWRQWIDQGKPDDDDEFYYKSHILDIMDTRFELLQANIIQEEEPAVSTYDLSGLAMAYTMIHTKEIEDEIDKYINYWLAK